MVPPSSSRRNRSVKRARGRSLLLAGGACAMFGGTFVLPAMTAGAASAHEQPVVAPGRILASGLVGEDVRRLQVYLNDHGAAPALRIDGVYGWATARAVRRFQLDHHLPADGLVGPLTWMAGPGGAAAALAASTSGVSDLADTGASVRSSTGAAAPGPVRPPAPALPAPAPAAAAPSVPASSVPAASVPAVSLPAPVVPSRPAPTGADEQAAALRRPGLPAISRPAHDRTNGGGAVVLFTLPLVAAMAAVWRHGRRRSLGSGSGPTAPPMRPRPS